MFSSGGCVVAKLDLRCPRFTPFFLLMVFIEAQAFWKLSGSVAYRD